jgi:hypothetical protein
MKTPEWLGPAIKGGIAGAVSVAIVGFAWGGWVTGGSAKRMASDQARSEVTAALTLVCLAQAKRDPDAAPKLAELKAASSYGRIDVVIKAGWATMPGASDASRDVASSCGDRLAA